ncbi:Endonuclease IV [Brevinematales bacterium NS]|nr:Endonuclease IV [Brevinematales bacterium NS]
MNRLAILTPGIPYSTKKPKGSLSALDRIAELGLDGIELEYVQGIRVDYTHMKALGEKAKSLGLVLTAHAPYYINLFSPEKAKIDKSYHYILDTARALDAAGGYSIVFHAAFYLQQPPHKVYPVVKDHLKHIADIAHKEALKVDIRPELMGKPTQFGSLDEILDICAEIGPPIKPCIDFAHLHARTGKFNSYEEFAKVFEKVKETLGEEALQDMHIHYSGIQYSAKGEQKHLILRKSDARYREFCRALIDYNIGGVLVIESPNIEGDTLLFKLTYQAMSD